MAGSFIVDCGTWRPSSAMTQGVPGIRYCLNATSLMASASPAIFQRL
ncbi:hypothetical protein OVX87_31945 [Klebsiella pneumoniae]|nr:hypothetical protein [Klebsiella pneumoniae]MCY0629506.1 hypothetical protein [Klebsiella pneumoniae]